MAYQPTELQRLQAELGRIRQNRIGKSQAEIGQSWGAIQDTSKITALENQIKNLIKAQSAPATTDSRYAGVVTPKIPELQAPVNDLLKSYTDSAKAFDWSKMLDEARANAGNVKAAYENYQTANDPTDAIARLRALDAAQSAETARYAGEAKENVGRYGGYLSDYEKKGGDIVAQILESGRKYREEDLPSLRGVAESGVTNYLNKFGVSNNRLGAGSEGIKIAGDRYMQAVAPLLAEARRNEQGLLTNVALPFASDTTNRRVGMVSGYETPLGQYVSNRYTGDIQSQKATEAQIYQMKNAAASGNIQAAIGIGRALLMPYEDIERILGMQAGTLARIIGLKEGTNYYGLEDTRGVDVSQPVGYNMSLPNQYPLPNRYAPGGGTATGTTAAPDALMTEVNRLRAARAALPQHVPTTPWQGSYDGGGGYTINDGMVSPLGSYQDIFKTGANYGPLTPGQRDYFNALGESYQ